MQDNKNTAAQQPEEEVLVYTLQDENGTEYEFAVIETYEKNGVKYYAMRPLEEEGGEEDILEYTILKGVMENGEETLVSLEDDDEFDDVAAYFDNLFSEEIDYDAPPKK